MTTCKDIGMTVEIVDRIVKNFIKNMPKVYRKRNTNYSIVKDIITFGTNYGGKTSAIDICVECGVEPYGDKWMKEVNENAGLD